MLGDPVESRRKESQSLRIEQDSPKGIASVAYVYEIRPPMVTPGRFSTLDQRSGEEIDVNEAVPADDNAKILAIVVLVERTVGASSFHDEAT